MSGGAREFFKIGGTLASDAACYVERQADRDLIEALRAGEFCYVLDTRQFGKSSLMSRTAARLREEGVLVAVIDLNALGECEEAEQWYFGMLDHLGEQLDRQGLKVLAALEKYWEERQSLAPMHRLMNAVRDVVLKATPQRLVIVVDEIDYVRKLSALGTDEFFAGIRECYNRRVRDPDFERLTFCLLGVASPSDLIKDTRVTPFNIGRRVELRDFTEAEAAGLRPGFSTDDATAAVLLKRVLHWTGGHPYLTQRLACAVAEEPTARSAEDVDRHCGELFLARSASEKDDNLIFVRDRVLRGSTNLVASLALYRKIRKGGRVPNDDANPLVGDLRLAGIIRPAEGRLEVRNRIYATVFDPAWIEKAMPDAERRRVRRAFARGLAAAVATALVVGGLYHYLWVWSFIEYYAEFEKAHGIPHGVTPLSEAEMRQRKVSFRFVHHGRKGPLVLVEAINGLGEWTPEHEVGLLIRPPEITSGPRRECMWEFDYDKDRLLSETARNAYREKVFSFVYTPQMNGEPSIRGKYWLDTAVLPQAPSGASQVCFVRDGNGFEIKRTFEDGNGKPRRDANRSFGYLFERDAGGRELARTTLGPDGRKPGWHKEGWVTRKLARDARGRITEVSFSDAAGDPVDCKEGYAKVVYELDGPGNIVAQRFFDALGNRTTNFEGIGGWTSKYDAHGLEIESAFFDVRDQPAILQGEDSGGYTRRVMHHDAHGFENERIYFNKDAPTVNFWGAMRMTCVNDPKGNRLQWQAWDAQGRPALDTHEYSAIKQEYDARGLRVSASYWDKDGRPTLSNEGTFQTKYFYDVAGREIERRFFGTDGKPTLNNDGYGIARWSFRDEINRFNWTEVAYLDTDEQPTPGPKNAPRITQRWEGADLREVTYRPADNAATISATPGSVAKIPSGSSAAGEKSPLQAKKGSGTPGGTGRESRQYADWSEEGLGVGAMNPDGYALKKNKFDPAGLGLLKEEAFFALDGNQPRPVALPRGEHLIKTEHDERGRAIESRNRDLANETPAGQAPVLRAEYGRFDKFQTLLFFGEEGRFALPGNKVAGFRFTHDYAGRRTSKTSLDLQDAPFDDGGFATYQQEYNARGHPVRESWLDAKGQPARGPDGHASSVIVPDFAGRETERRFFKTDGQLLREGYLWAIRRQTLDERGRVVEKAFFDADEKPTRNNEGAARVTYAYDERGRVREEQYFDEKGQTALHRNGYAIKRMINDARGRVVQKAYFDAAGRPTRGAERVAMLQYSYDERGRVIKERCFDETGQPTQHRDGYVTRGMAYDEQGRVIEERSFDATDKPAPHRDGYAIKRMTYDARGRLASEAFFNESEAPIELKDDAQRISYTRDEQDRITEKRFYRADPAGVFASKVQRLDEKGRLVEERYLDAKDQLTENVDKYAIKKVEFDPQLRWTNYFYYDREGKTTRTAIGFQEITITPEKASGATPGTPASTPVARRRFKGFDGSKGYVTREDLVDAEGNALEQRFLDVDDKLVRNSDGYAMSRSTFDERGRLLRLLFFAPDGSPARSRSGAMEVVATYDLPGGTARNVLRGFDGSDGYVARADLLDAAGNPLEQRFLDAQEQLVRRTGGYAIIRSTFDQKGRRITSRYLDAEGRPAPVLEGATEITVTYDLPDGGTRELRTGFDGSEGYVAREDLLNSAGKAVEQRFRDGEDKIVRSMDGYAIVRSTFDPQGRPLRILFLDPDESPAQVVDGAAEIVLSYDLPGGNARRVKTGFDARLGFARSEERLDPQGVVIEESFFAADGRRVVVRPVVRTVIPSGQAMRLGLRPGDLLLSYAGKPLGSVAELRRLTPLPGAETRELRLWREGKVQAFSVAPGPLGIEIVNGTPEGVPAELLAGPKP